jgi:hypothetical protein
MTIVLTIGVTLAALFFILFVRRQDLPEPVPVSPLAHLEDRKAAIYENLRDLQFEYRLGKLSDADYQATKLALQKELAGVLAEMEATAAKLGLVTKRTPAVRPPQTAATQKALAQKREAPAQAAVSADGRESATATVGSVCASCGAEFEKSLKFCGECGKAMA